MRTLPLLLALACLLAPAVAPAQNPVTALRAAKSCRSASVLADLTGPILGARTAANLKLGDPIFLEPYWAELERAGLFTRMGAAEQMSYVGTDADPLHQSIKTLHQRIGNAETAGYEVVVAHGATQVIQAAMWAQHRLDGTRRFYVAPPYWFQFPNLIEAGGFEVARAPAASATQIVTTPSNPIGEPELASPASGSVIHDLSYHWPQYGSEGAAAHDLMIFSLSKGTGHAGTRVGWALVKDPETAAAMREYIQLTTGGVSADAEARAATIIGSQLEIPFDETVFAYGADVLAARWAQLGQTEHPLRVLNTQGTFVWGEAPWLPAGTPPAAALEEAGVLGVEGSLCGGGPGQVRLNIGCSAIEFRTLLDRLPGLGGP